jgi:hypothetical protein
VCDTATYVTSGFTPNSLSCAASVFARLYVIAPLATTIPSGIAATASVTPVPHSSTPLVWRMRYQLSENSIGLPSFTPGDQRP